MTVPVAIVDAIRLGYQRGYVTHALSILSSILVVISLFVVAALHPTLPLFILALSGPPIVFQLVNWALLNSVTPTAAATARSC